MKVSKNHITIVLWQINIMEKENNSKVHMSFKASSQNECRVKYHVQIINLQAVPQHMHDHVTYNEPRLQGAVPQINL